jgi:hypothetical protein
MEYKKSTYKKKAAAGKAEYKPKRGPLSKLMSEEDKAKAGILEWFTVHGSR